MLVIALDVNKDGLWYLNLIDICLLHKIYLMEYRLYNNLLLQSFILLIL